ncbi:hypothetical protein [Gracilibacillus boraciitolerans]|nr:hypothetical protein [Gracilibacillus boraciitolerans]
MTLMTKDNLKELIKDVRDQKLTVNENRALFQFAWQQNRGGEF